MAALSYNSTYAAGPQRASRLRRALRASDIYVPLAFLVTLGILCFIVPLVFTLPAGTNGNILYAGLPIGARGHILGTDPLGNDEFARLLAGGRVSLEVGFATQAIGIVIGGTIGMFAGFAGGLADAIVMRILDMFIAFPSLVLVLAIVDGLGPGEVHIIWALSIFSIPAFGRLSRAATLRIREQSFIFSARVSGARRRQIIFRHIVPNIAPQLLTFALLGAGIAILIEGALSYLGYGVPPPGPSWGNMIAEGQAVMSADPRFVFIPSVALLLSVICLNTLGDGLRIRWGLR